MYICEKERKHCVCHIRHEELQPFIILIITSLHGLFYGFLEIGRTFFEKQRDQETKTGKNSREEKDMIQDQKTGGRKTDQEGRKTCKISAKNKNTDCKKMKRNVE